MTTKVKRVKPSCTLRLSFQKTTIPSSPTLKFLDHDSIRKAINNFNQSSQKKGQKRLNAQFSFPVKLCLKCKDFFIVPVTFDLLCVMSLPPAVQVTQGGIKEQWVVPGFDCASGFV